MRSKTVATIILVPLGLVLISLFDPYWRTLSSNFSSDTPGLNLTQGETVHIYRAETLGPMRYRKLMSVGVDDSGIFLRFDFPLRLLHHPVRIPWPEITAYSLTSWSDHEETNIWIPRTRAEVGFTESSSRIRRELELRHVRQVDDQTLDAWRGIELRK